MTIPCVLRETASGLSRTTTADEAYRHREVELSDAITVPVAMEIIRQMRVLAGQDAEKPITLVISSPGGEVVAGLAIYDTMMALPCPIYTVCVGEAASMASLLFAAGKHRSILPSATVMVHDPLIGGSGVTGSALTVEAMTSRLMRIRQQVAERLARHTGHTVDEVLDKTARDTYFAAKEAVQWGLADEILEHWGGFGHAG